MSETFHELDVRMKNYDSAWRSYSSLARAAKDVALLLGPAEEEMPKGCQRKGRMT